MKAEDFDARFERGEGLASALDLTCARRPGLGHKRVNAQSGLITQLKQEARNGESRLSWAFCEDVGGIRRHFFTKCRKIAAANRQLRLMLTWIDVSQLRQSPGSCSETSSGKLPIRAAA